MKRRTCLIATLLLVGASCSDDTDTNTTPGFRVTLETRFELASEPTFENAMGWKISLTKVAMSSGPLYYFDGAPIESAARGIDRKPGSLRRRTPILRALPELSLGLFGPSTAYAHPGHYNPGEAKGEMLATASFDLVSGPADLAAGEGTSGVFRSARFSWQSPAEGALAAELGSNVLILEGTATKDDLEKVFRLVAAQSDTLDAADKPELEGCTFEEVDIQSDGRVTVSVDPRVWLDQADFSDVDDSPDGAPLEVSAELEAARAFVRGIKKSTAFTFRFTSLEESP
jgi:hypothetical protein